MRLPMPLSAHLLALLSAAALISASPFPAGITDEVLGSNQLLDARGCTSSTQCSSSQYCDYGVCRTKDSLNATCRKDQQCKSGLCFNTKCTSSTSRPNGAACTDSTTCSSGNCQNSLCAAKKSTGGACYKDVNCSSGSCDKTKGTCAAAAAGNLLSNGKACTTSPSCSSGNCQNSVCVAKKSNGGSCYKDANCTSGTCDKTASKCIAATTPPSNSAGSNSGPPTPASKTALPTGPARLPSGNGMTTDADFISQQPVALAGSNGDVQQTTVNSVPLLQITVPQGGSSSFTVPVTAPVVQQNALRARQSPAGMIVTYQYQVQSISIANKWQGSQCYIYPSYGLTADNTPWGDYLKPLKIFQVDPTWQTTQSYGRYEQGSSTPWTNFNLQVMCEQGVSGVVNIASVSHSEGDAPTVTDFYPVPDVTPVAGVEVFTNGGFETGTLAGWTDYSNAQIVSGTAGGNVYAGTKAVQLTVGGAAGVNATISQVLSPLGAPARKRQINQGTVPSPFDQLEYEIAFYMRVTSLSVPAGTTGGSCYWWSYYDGHFAGHGNYVNDPVALGWQTVSAPDYKIYVKNYDAARTFEFILTCPDGVSSTMLLDGFSAKAKFVAPAK